MPHDESSENDTPADKTSGIINAATGLVKEIPIYQDALQPLAKEVGRALATLGKTVNMILAPLAAMVWSYERIQGFIERRLAEKLEHVPTERLQTPPPEIAVPALEALRYTGNNEEIREMFAALLATSMDSEGAEKAHPAFVEIIKQLTSDEARIVRFLGIKSQIAVIDIRARPNIGATGFSTMVSNFSHIWRMAGCDDNGALSPAYLQNLCRLGLTEIPDGLHLTDDEGYLELESDPVLEGIKEFCRNQDQMLIFRRKFMALMPLGRVFGIACAGFIETETGASVWIQNDFGIRANPVGGRKL